MKSFSIPLPFGGRAYIGFERHGALWLPGGIKMFSNLSVDILRANGLREHRNLGSGTVTAQGVQYLGANWKTPAALSLTYHDSSTGTTAAAVGDTALATAPAATVGSRVAGSTSASGNSGNNYDLVSVATQSYTGSLAITEWGLFRLARTAGNSPPASDTLWDRKVFSAINVSSGDSIQFTYTLTINSGG
jgi:hypothetical protein